MTNKYIFDKFGEPVRCISCKEIIIEGGGAQSGFNKPDTKHTCERCLIRKWEKEWEEEFEDKK